MTIDLGKRFLWLLAAGCALILAQNLQARDREVSEETVRECWADVRRAMVRREVQHLDPKVQQAVDRLCSLGRAEEALIFAFPSPAIEDCIRRVQAIRRSGDERFEKEELSEADQLCRHGKVDEALAILNGESDPRDRKVPGFPKITSFEFTPASIRPGQTTVLEWAVEDADQALVGESNPNWPRDMQEPILEPRAVPAVGRLKLSPTQTIKYRLYATHDGKSVLKDVTVVVANAPREPVPPQKVATCSIAGRLSGRLRWDTKDDRGQPVSYELEHVLLSVPGADRPMVARVQGREYVFKNVPAGQRYRIHLGAFRSQPREVSVECRAGAVRRGVNFEITGPPSSG